MTAQVAALSREYPIGRRYRVTFTSPPLSVGIVAMTAEWSPHVPANLTPRERRDYEAARSQFLGELMGGE